MKKILKISLALLVILCNISCDQITKDKARKEISTHETIPVIKDNFILTKVENTGAALSAGQNLSPTLKIVFLQAIPILVLLLMFLYIIKKNVSRSSLIAISFIIGGGIGNIYDRILYNSVTDFMYLEVGFLHTGIFNMADVSIVIGTCLIFLEHIILSVKNHFTKNSAFHY